MPILRPKGVVWANPTSRGFGLLTLNAYISANMNRLTSNFHQNSQKNLGYLLRYWAKC